MSPIEKVVLTMAITGGAIAAYLLGTAVCGCR